MTAYARGVADALALVERYGRWRAVADHPVPRPGTCCDAARAASRRTFAYVPASGEPDELAVRFCAFCGARLSPLDPRAAAASAPIPGLGAVVARARAELLTSRGG